MYKSALGSMAARVGEAGEHLETAEARGGSRRGSTEETDPQDEEEEEEDSPPSL